MPHELDEEQRGQLVRAIAQHLVDCYGVAVMAALHAPSDKGDQRNQHVHLLMTTRRLGPEGFGSKVRVLDDQKTGPQEVEALRRHVADLTNAHLAAAGLSDRVDHRTLHKQAAAAARRGDEAAVVALSRAALQREDRASFEQGRRGVPSAQRHINERIRADNAELARLGQERAKALRQERPRRIWRPFCVAQSLPRGLSSVQRRYLAAICRAAEQSLRDITALLAALRAQAVAADRLADVWRAQRKLHRAWAYACAAQSGQSERKETAQPSRSRADICVPHSRTEDRTAAQRRATETRNPSVLSRRQWAEKRRQGRKNAQQAAIGFALREALGHAVIATALLQPKPVPRPVLRPSVRP